MPVGLFLLRVGRFPSLELHLGYLRDIVVRDIDMSVCLERVVAVVGIIEGEGSLDTRTEVFERTVFGGFKFDNSPVVAASVIDLEEEEEHGEEY